jgi:hypothetical protein
MGEQRAVTWLRALPLAVAVVLTVTVLVVAGTAGAANEYAIPRVGIEPSGKGSTARPLPVGVLFGLRVSEEDPALRPAPIESYALAAEGLVVRPRLFASCSLRRLGRRRGVPRECERAKVGGGRIRGAAGLVEDQTLEGSVPCNLRLRVYNTGSGMALRLDGQPPVPPGLGSKRLGCPVPVHLAIRVRTVETRIDGVRSTELRYTLPDRLLHPIEGWDASLRLVEVSLDRKRARRGRRTVGFYSAAGCSGAERTVRVVFVDPQGGRAEATRSTGC